MATFLCDVLSIHVEMAIMTIATKLKEIGQLQHSHVQWTTFLSLRRGSEEMGRYRPIPMMSILIVEQHFHDDDGAIVKDRPDLDCELL